ncbi:MAG: acylphosphatase [Lentimicrobiaceae bacterium]|nr:acylphosphatase [Lentimicrobiaceae bacterium]MCB9023722.1 acylphosphatase [Lentimicrobiaceae bacterium]MCO5266245.1 acylphosphatase [Lentimicrobium sp.]
MNKKNLTIRVYGRVQGVGFRYFTQKAARSCGIYGFVKNESDGSVFIEAEGAHEQLITFQELCKQGPARAAVSHIKVIEGPVMNYHSFSIR